MTNRNRKLITQTSQRGVALIAALFLIVVLAALGLAAIRVGGAQQQTVNLGLLGDRAIAAANGGIEYGAYQARIGNCANYSDYPAFDLKQGTLNGFRVTVTCFPAGPGVFTLTSTASSGVYGSPDYVWRRVTR